MNNHKRNTKPSGIAAKLKSIADEIVTLATVDMMKDMFDTLAARDEELEKLWDGLADIPTYKDDDYRQRIEAGYLHFPKGTDVEDIWHWFDERHSKGIAYLLYGGQEDYTSETRRLYGLKKSCCECDAAFCAFNPDGVCAFPLVYGRAPKMDDDGCEDYTWVNQDVDPGKEGGNTWP